MRGESAFINPSDADADRGIDQVIADEPTPAFAAQVADQCREMLDRLGDESLQQIAIWKMEGYTNTEIADKLGCAPRTVERKLERIRAKWEHGGSV